MADLKDELAHVQELIAQRRWDEALRSIGPLRREHPEVGDVWRCQAMALRGAGHGIEALVAAEKWMQFSPGSDEARAFYREVEFERLAERSRQAESAHREAINRIAALGPESSLAGGFGPDDSALIKRKHTARRLMAALIVVAMVVALVLVPAWRSDLQAIVTRPTSDKAAPYREVPNRDLEPSEVQARAEPSSGGSWEFLEMRDGSPVRHDPCTVIRYKVRVGSGPADAVELAHEAIARVSDATGLTFSYEGLTDEVPQKRSGTVSTVDSPLVIAWANPDETDLFADVGGDASAEAVGVGGPIVVRGGDGSEWYVGGFVVVRTDVPTVAGFGPGTSQGNVLLHELGHVVGLAHVDDPNELMSPWTTESTLAGYGPGDLYGLWRLGASQGCL